MTTDVVGLDPRLPAVVSITEPTRQQRRLVARKAVPCALCRDVLTGDTVCLAAGRFDVHRSCAESWNAEIRKAAGELAEADAARAAKEAECQTTAQEPGETPDAAPLTA